MTEHQAPSMPRAERSLLGTHIGLAFANAAAGFYTGLLHGQGQPVSLVPLAATLGGGITLDTLLGAYIGRHGDNDLPPGERIGPISMGFLGGIVGTALSASGAGAGYVAGLASGYVYSLTQ